MSGQMRPLGELRWDDEGPGNPFIVLVEYLTAMGVTKLGQLVEPGECYYVRIDDTWDAWINPHKIEATAHLTEKSLGGTHQITPFECYITYNGFPWATGHPYSMSFVEHPDEGAANVARFYRDCVSALTAEAAR